MPHDLQQTAGELRELIREAHGLLKDLRTERRAVERLLDGIGDRVDTRIDDAVKTGLEQLGESTRQAMDNAVAKVGKEFERLERIFLGTDAESRRSGLVPLEDLFREAAAKRGAGRG